MSRSSTCPAARPSSSAAPAASAARLRSGSPRRAPTSSRPAAATALVDEVAGRDRAPGPADAAAAGGRRRRARRSSALRDACLEAFGTVDILVCAAGITKRVPTLEMDDADWQRIMDTNLTGTLRAARCSAATMVARRPAASSPSRSLSSFVGLFEVAAYVASKSAVAGLTRALAVEWAPHNVTVNAIAPGRVPHRPQRGAARLAARPGVPDADADEALRPASTSWSARRCSSRRMPRRSSPATCSRSTAASSRAG